MINQVQIHSNQQMALGDVMKLQSFVDDTFQHLIMDAITNERLYVGLTISEFTPTQIQIAAGRLWDGPTGKIYDLAEAQTVSVQTNLPVADERWLAVSVVGQQVDAAQTVVSILIDAENEDWESQTEYTEKHRQAAVHITAGIEAPDPQKPTVPTGYLLIGYVRLTTTGVVEIQMAENQILKSLWEVYQQVLGHQVMLDVIEPKISTLISDLAQLAKQIRGTAYQDMLMNLAQDVGHLKDLAELPDSYSLYGGDDYLDDSESDTGNAEYLARVDEGIRFAWAGQTEQQPALFNTYDASVTDFDGLILPAGQKVVRLNITDGYAGGLSISQYQQQTHTMKTGQRQKRRIRYGPTRKVCTNSNNWRNGKKSPVGSVFEANGATWVVKERWGEHSGHWWMRVQQIWVDTWTESYTYWETTNHVINGAQIAQTILNAQNGWLAAIDLYFTKTGEEGDVHIHWCETDLGKPDPERCVGKTSVAASALKLYPEPTHIEFTQPIFQEAGKRYAPLITTPGDHSVAVVSGTEYTNGTLFQSTDGDYHQGDFTKDLMMRLHFLQFDNPRTEVMLSSLSLSNGIADLDFLLEAVVPENTDLLFEYQKEGSGEWYPVVAETADQLLGLPAMVAMRAVFDGSQDMMPGLYLPGSRLQANRPRTDFKHISVNRVLGGASEDIDIVLQLENWDESKHTCVAKLLSGGSTYTHDSVTDTVIADAELPTIKRVVNFLPVPGTGISEFQIQIEGTTTTALDIFHVAKGMYVAK